MRTFRNPLGVLAIVLVALAFAAPKSVAKKNGSQQEYNDGVTALIAVCVLLTATPTQVVLPLHIDLCVCDGCQLPG